MVVGYSIMFEKVTHKSHGPYKLQIFENKCVTSYFHCFYAENIKVKHLIRFRGVKRANSRFITKQKLVQKKNNSTCHRIHTLYTYYVQCSFIYQILNVEYVK